MRAVCARGRVSEIDPRVGIDSNGRHPVHPKGLSTCHAHVFATVHHRAFDHPEYIVNLHSFTGFALNKAHPQDA
jgi:hypothetical protein